MKKVLVTGANGQLGKCIQDLTSLYPELEFTFTTSKELDITNKDLVNSYFSNRNYDYCINCAAYTAVDKAETEREKAFLVNAEAVKYLAESCKFYDTILIHISTDFVFDGSKGAPYSEEDLPNPINVYGSSKLKGEKYVQKILENFFIIRTSWVYSEYGNNFVKTMLSLAKVKDEIKVVHDQIGSPTYALDLAGYILCLINMETKNYGIFHYSNTGEISWYEFAKSIFDISQKPVLINPITSTDFPALAMRPKYSLLINGQKDGIKRLDWLKSLKQFLLKNQSNINIVK